MSDLAEYTANVLDYLEYIGYVNYIQFFNAEQVAQATSSTIAQFHEGGQVGFRMCAIVIFSMTMNYQVMRAIPKEKIH